MNDGAPMDAAGPALAQKVPAQTSRAGRVAHPGRLFRKYLLLILTLVTIALLASGGIGIYFTYQETKAALASLQHEKAVAAAARIEQYVDQVEQQLAFAALPQIDPNDVEMRRVEFLKLLRQAPIVTDVAQIDSSGRERVAVSRLGMDRVNSGRDRSGDAAFVAAKPGQPWFGPVYFHKETEPYMTIAVRNGGDHGPLTIADVNLKFIWDVVSRIRIGNKGKAYVVDDKGYLVADPDIGLVLRKTNLAALPHVQAAMSRHPGNADAMVSVDLAGIPVLTSVAPIESLKWNVFVEQPVSEVYAKLDAAILRTALLLLAGLGLSAFGALALARGMVRPIRTLEEGAQRIAAGDLDQKIDIRTGDELEALAGQFNRMSGALRESYADLEQKVTARTRELQEALEQQTATSHILRVISSSLTDVQPVFDSIAERAAMLCGARFAFVTSFDGELIHMRATHGPGAEEHRSGYPIRPGQGSIAARVIRDRATVQIDDMLTDDQYAHKDAATRQGFRSGLGVPMLRDGHVVGCIVVTRPQTGAMPERLVRLLQTFADQAVIAIENVRLFNETKEALERQTAMSEILRVISRSPTDVQPVFDTIASAALGLCNAVSALVFTYDGELVHLAANANVNPEDERAWREAFPRPPSRETAVARAILTADVVMIADVLDDPDYAIGATAISTGFRSCMGVPLMRDNRPIGALGVGRPQPGPFGQQEIAILQTFADQAVIAIENVRLFNETKEALEQQTAVAEILRVISSSPTDVQPVLDAIADRAARLCDASAASMYLLDGNVLRHLSSRGPSPDPVSHVDTLAIDRASISGRAFLERRAIEVEDMLAQSAEYPSSFALAKRFQHRTVLVLPLLREGQPFGTILLRRREVRRFSERERALLQTFGDQAAIALENVRLFNETKEALDQQRASGEVLAAISSSIADTSPVFERILQSCERLFAGRVIAIERVTDANEIVIAAYRGPQPEHDQTNVGPVQQGASISANAIVSREVQHYPDVSRADDVPARSRAAYAEIGARGVIVAPMVWEGHGLGAISVGREHPGAFSEKEITLLKTFADQAVIAIQNARLFNETKEALDQQRASGEVLAAISSSIADTQPVFERILGSCERLFAGRLVQINLVGDDGLVRIGGFHGPRSEDLERIFPFPVDEASATGLCILTRSVVHYPDVDGDAEHVPERALRGWKALGIKAAIAAPMLWEGRGIGSILVGRDNPGPFSQKEIALLKTFADQAVIAIQNARLFHEIEDKSRQLEIANKHKSEFLANMSHELRTPLNAIIGFSEVLLERLFGDLNVKQDDYLKDIHSSGKHLLSLINDILDLSKIEAGRMELEPSPVDVSVAIANALSLIRERAQAHGIALAQHVDSALGTIVADERKFKQILLNLLSNAVKFTPDGGRIEVTARRADGVAEIAVRDTGIGIAPEDQAAVFEEFRQVGRDYTKKQEGTGLGLALTRRFVELHGGHIRLESAPGQGSTFTFTIPLPH